MPSIPFKIDSESKAVANMLREEKADLPLKNPFQQRRAAGMVEVGGIQGALPYSTPGLNDLNAFARGQVGFSVGTIPLQVLFDLGTDVPLRGQRNSIRLTLDRDKLLRGAQVTDAVSLHDQDVRLDSLRDQRAVRYRAWRAALYKLQAAQNTLVKDTTLAAPALPTPDTDTALTTPSISAVPGPSHLDVDSLQHMVNGTEEELRQVDEAIATAERERQRTAAFMNAAKDKTSGVRGLLSGIEHFDIGSCSPTSSEFLINGITFQGVSLAYSRNDLYFSLDKGRSFDDSWMATDRVRSQLETLQRSLFLADTRDLTSRNITAVRAGFGAPEHSHVHLGYLFGQRADIPLGYDGSLLDPGTRRNHVIEADLGLEIRPGHLVRAVVARSLTVPGSGDTEEGTGNVSDLFQRGNGRNMAAKVIWSSKFERSGMNVDLEGRTIASDFESMGMGFIRNGSRAAEARLGRSLGKAWKVRGRYVLEQRTPPGEGQSTVDLKRAQVQVNFRPSRKVTLRAMYLPMVTYTRVADGPTLIGRTTSASLGGDVDRRWGRLNMTATADIGMYTWTASGSNAQQALNGSASLVVRSGDHLQGRVLWSALKNYADTLAAPVSNLSFWLRWTVVQKWEAEAGVQVPSGHRCGWSVAMQRNVTRSVRLALRGMSYSRSDLLLSDLTIRDRSSIYTWSCSLIYSW